MNRYLPVGNLTVGYLTACVVALLIAPTPGFSADDPAITVEQEQPLLLAPPRDAAPAPVPNTVIRQRGPQQLSPQQLSPQQRGPQQRGPQQRVTPSAAETVSPETVVSPEAAAPTGQPLYGQAPYASGAGSPEGAPGYLPEQTFPQGPLPGELQPVVLYRNVRIRDPHRAHPLGVLTIIAVPDPRDHCGVVYVEVCMPPCPCLSFWHNRRGTRAEFDFGRYEIDIITRRGVVIIDYDS